MGIDGIGISKFLNHVVRTYKLVQYVITSLIDFACVFEVAFPSLYMMFLLNIQGKTVYDMTMNTPKGAAIWTFVSDTEA